MNSTPTSKPQILAISGSLRQDSSNHAILNFLSSLNDQVAFTIYNGLSHIPAFDPDLDTDQPPSAVASLRKLIIEADGIVICTPEYAFGIPGALKNALDWMVSSSTFSGKPVSLITASLVGEYAHAALLKVLSAIDSKVIDDAVLLIPFIRSKMDSNGNITDANTSEKLVLAYQTLLQAIPEVTY